MSGADATVAKLVRAGVDGSLAFLRGLDPDAAAELDALRRQEVTQPRRR